MPSPPRSSSTGSLQSLVPPPAPEKTWPTRSAGPHFPASPLTDPLLRIIPGNPRFARPALDWLISPPHPSSSHIRLTHAHHTAHISLPAPTANPTTDLWFDFSVSSLDSTFIKATVSSTDDTPVYHAVFLLSDFSARQGTLLRPVLDSHNNPVAQLTLTFLYITPLDPLHLHTHVPKSAFVPRFTGHRGMGSSGPHAPWRLPENTIESFLCAALADTNVSTVELDVQLTKDNQCVVYHDWYIRPRGLDARPVYDHDAVRAPVYSLTFHQFDALYRQGLQADLCMSEKRIAFRKWAHDKHDIPLSAFDACARTLRQVCDLLPPHISILLELKYPSEDVQEAGLLPYPEMNHYIDLILADLPAHSARKIAFLSFHPDICLMLSLKQTRHPVYFSHCETDDKPCDEFDPRCVDLREGVRFVKAHGVDGIMAYAPLVESKPRIVEDFVADGYPVITYGDRNCDQAHVQAQFDLGVSGVIADDVDVLAAKFGSVAV